MIIKIKINLLLILKIFIIIFSSTIKLSESLQLSQQDISNCGISKGCAFFPPKCDSTLIAATRDTNCTGAFIFQTFSSGIYFTLLGTTNDIAGAGYTPMFVAVGFSLDEHMGDDTVIACVVNGTGGTLYAGWNDKTRGYLQRDATPKHISNTSNIYNNGEMRCSGFWSFRPSAPLLQPSHIYNLSNPEYSFHFLFARGYADPYSGELTGHATIDSTAFPWISTNSIQFCESQNSCNGSSNSSQLANLNQAHQSAIPRKIKHMVAGLHGIFMMASWWCIAGPSILIARYLKCSKTSCWFQFHRIFMILVFLLVSAAFFGILYQAEWRIFTCSFVCDYEAYVKQVHTIIGFCVYILLWFQVLFGIFRPSKTSSIRHCYNWLHSCCGLVAWIGASTCCVLGIHLGKTGLSYGWGQNPEHLMTIIVGSFFICAIICEFSSRRNKYKPENDDNKVRAVAADDESKEGGYNCCSLFFVLAYFCISVAVVALLSAMLVSTYFQRGFTI